MVGSGHIPLRTRALLALAGLDLAYPAGVRGSYFYPNPSIFGFTSGGRGSPIVGRSSATGGFPRSAVDRSTTRGGRVAEAPPSMSARR